MKRVLILAALAATALTAPAEALATNECDGLDVCISVPGPWVAVPGSSSGRLRTVEFQLSCPRGSIAGGLDAVLVDRSLSVRFLGKLGSPVNPGISTERSVVFVASHARRAPTAFRPLLGCIPTSGGGGRSTTAAGAVPARPPVRLVRSVRVLPGRQATLAVSCRAGERLVSSSHVVTFRGRTRTDRAGAGSRQRRPRRARCGGAGARPPQRRRPARQAGRRPGARDLREGAGMSFEWPLALLALLLVPIALAVYLWSQRRPSSYALAFPNLGVLETVVGGGGWRRWVPPALFLLALSVLGVALARPHVNVTVQREQATVVLAIDSSGSMRAEDVAPTRMGAAQAAVRSFLKDLPPKFRVGMVTFAGEAQVVAPPTTDRELVLQLARLPRPASRHGDRRRRRPRRGGRPAGGRAGGHETARERVDGRAGAAGRLGAGGRAHPLRRLPDRGPAATARGRRTGEAARHPRLLDRPRHRRGRARPQLRR